MKRFFPYLVVAFLVLLIVAMYSNLGRSQRMIVVTSGNFSKQPVDMELNRYQDGECGMIIDDLSYASQVVAPDGKTWFFHDHGGMAAWLSTKDFQDEAVIWVRDRSAARWIDGRTAWYSRTEETPMFYGFGAYPDSAAGYITFPTMQALMLRGETMANPKYRRYLLGE